MKTTELTGSALDWAVAKCEGIKEVLMAQTWDEGDHTLFYYDRAEEIIINYSTDWAQGGPIIEREKINILFHDCCETGKKKTFEANKEFHYNGMELYYTHAEEGPTPLIAAMRCYVASKLGDDIEIPEELLNGLN